MRDIIALDIDNVIADTKTTLHEYLYKKHGFLVDWSKVKHFKLEKFPNISKELVDDVIHEMYFGDIPNQVLPYNYSEHALNKLHNEGFSIVMVTSRPAHLKSTTLDWLNRWNLKHDSVYHAESEEKYNIIQNLSAKAFIEDRPDILDSVVQKCGVLEYGLFLVDHPWNEKYDKENLIKVDNVANAIDRIVEYRKWKNFFVAKCQGNIDKFIKEYFDGK